MKELSEFHKHGIRNETQLYNPKCKSCRNNKVNSKTDLVLNCYDCDIKIKIKLLATRCDDGKYRCKRCIAKKNTRKVKYGITAEQFKLLANKQDGLCAICKKQEKLGTALSVDHCHESGRIRGLLCRQCNVGIGNLGHDIELLEKAIKYLMRG